ncbi:MAG: 3-phosphoshikimate 1-carboxyvinyltransferase [Bacteroidia bacterium]
MQKTGNAAIIHPLTKPVDAVVKVPGSKSFTNRALVIAALANGVTTLHGASDSNDSKILIKLLDRLGVEIIEHDGVIQVRGNSAKFDEFNGVLNVEDSGTVMRFLTALCCLVPGEITLEGTERMNRRPIKGLVDALTKLGAEITYLDNEGFPPIKINGGHLRGGSVYMDGSVSSQFVSALLMIAPLLPMDTSIYIEGEQVSVPYIDMTNSVMKQFGAGVQKSAGNYSINGDQIYKATEYRVEGDASSASYLFAFAALSQSTVEVTNMPGNSLQSDTRFAGILQKMGCTVNKTVSSISVKGGKTLKAIEVDMQDMPDTAPTLAVVAAFAEGETVITGLKTLQLKESKRITALKNELIKLGVECATGSDYIKIKGGNPVGTFINSYNDHRIAMAFALAGARVPGITIESPQVVKKSFPAFWTTLQSMGLIIDME